ncbi:MAG: hypothetical protein IPM89_06480 [Candidatus Competibacteraceae bacterium]|nr:MAG: hypothetical protein IPM89_06480 [Candidatus Competibacteraceae bacterium]
MTIPELPQYPGPDSRPPGRALAERQTGVPMPAPPREYPSFEEASEEDALNLRELWQVILKRRWSILIFTLIVVTATVVATYLMTPLYRASLTLQIDLEDIKIMKMGDVSPVESGWGSQDYYQTQYELLKSRSLALRVVNQMGLADQQAQADAPPPSLGAQLKGWLAGWLPAAGDAKAGSGQQDAGSAPTAETARVEGAIDAVLGGLTVEPVRNSRLVILRYDSPDPKLTRCSTFSRRDEGRPMRHDGAS